MSNCGGAAQGRYVTVDHAGGGGGSSGGSVITICEMEVWGYMEGGSAVGTAGLQEIREC
eukprot:COSAG06_NODE_70015_length_194_cov_43.536842_1_plen_58_part_01